MHVKGGRSAVRIPVIGTQVVGSILTFATGCEQAVSTAKIVEFLVRNRLCFIDVGVDFPQVSSETPSIKRPSAICSLALAWLVWIRIECLP